MAEATGLLTIKESDGTTKEFSWNGDVTDRAAAKAAFDAAMSEGGKLAVAFDSPGKSRQVRSFTEVEQIEKERGVVSAQITTGLVGG